MFPRFPVFRGIVSPIFPEWPEKVAGEHVQRLPRPVIRAVEIEQGGIGQRQHLARAQRAVGKDALA